ncbi:MAG: hypothetical protein IT437_01995 [Phycisphaerales bacterium]|nr:hypothetical protein [Phycisphaerales bacterium]
MGNDPDMLVDLTTARSDFEAQVIVESLRGQGVPAEAFTTAGIALPLDLGSTQPFRIAVRRRDLASASAALRAIRAESVDIDWDEVDVGQGPEPAAVAAPSAGQSRRRRWRVVVTVTLYGLCAVALGGPVYSASMFLVSKYDPAILAHWTPGRFIVAYLVLVGVLGVLLSALSRRGG